MWRVQEQRDRTGDTQYWMIISTLFLLKLTCTWSLPALFLGACR